MVKGGQAQRGKTMLFHTFCPQDISSEQLAICLFLTGKWRYVLSQAKLKNSQTAFSRLYCDIKSSPYQTSDVSEYHAHVLQDTNQERESTTEDTLPQTKLDTCLSTWSMMCFPWSARTPSNVDKSTREVRIKAGG